MQEGKGSKTVPTVRRPRTCEREQHGRNGANGWRHRMAVRRLYEEMEGDELSIKSSTRSENEVIIRFSEADDIAIIYSASPLFTTKMKKLEEVGAITLMYEQPQFASYQWRCAKSLITIRAKRKSNLTDEQKRVMSARLRKVAT
jgi:hypothetical protein